MDFGFGTPFAAQLDFFRQKLNLQSHRWDSIVKAAHDRSFVVAGVTKAGMLADFRAAVDASIAGQMTMLDFRNEFNAIAKRHGWTGFTGDGSRAGRAWRADIIWQTNVSTSFAAGRYQQLTDPDVLAVRKYWVYRHLDGQENPRVQHQSWDRITLPHDHKFWQTHFPPNGWHCHCWVTNTDARGYAKAALQGKGDAPTGWDKPDPVTGAPKWIDTGFDYAPGASVGTPLVDLVNNRLAKLPASIGAQMSASLNPVIAQDQLASFQQFFDDVLQDGVIRGRQAPVGALKQKWVQAAEDNGISVVSADMIVRDKDILHTFRDAKKSKLSKDWYRNLPQHLQSPQAVLFDKSHPNQPALLLIYPQADNLNKKLVVQINYKIKKDWVGNVVETGKIVDSHTINAQIGNRYQLVEGSL